MFRKSSPWVVVLFLLFSNAAMSLGLGDIKLNSSLNQPLNAEITLLSAESLSKSQIVVNLASEEDFNRAGVEHLFFLRGIRFVPIFKEDGSVTIRLSTKKSIKEPFLDFLIEVNWPNGRIMREYTLLLDPPAFSEVEMGTAPEAAISSSDNSFQPQQVDTNTITQDSWSGNESEDQIIGDYRVKSADTLWSIARKNRNSNTSIQQTMVSIFNDNRNAFINDNMNELKTGSVLNLEGATLQAGLTQQQALLEIARQNQLWGGSGNAGTRPDAVLDTADYASVSTTSANTEPRLKLASAGEGNVDGVSGSLESEAVTTLIDENESLRNRLNGQSERIEKLERLLELQSGLAAVGEDNEIISDNSNFEEQQTTLALDDSIGENSNEDGTEVATLEPEATENPLTGLNDSAALEGADNNGLDNQPSTDANSTEVDSAIAETSAPKPIVKEASITSAPVKPVKEESFIDSVLNLGSMVWLAIISGLLVLFFSFLWIRRQNMAEEEFQESLVVPVTNDFDEEDLPEIGDDILAAEMNSNPDYIPESDVDGLEEDGVDIETNADPLGEADVYLAYGKFDQAERILRDALENEPERLDLRLKIMECFAETKSLSEFKDQKREILEVLATDDAIAEQVNIMERQAWPEESEKVDDIPSTEDIFGDLSFANEDVVGSDELIFPDERDSDNNNSSSDDSEDVGALDFTAANPDVDTQDKEASDSSDSDEFIDEDIDLESDDNLDFMSSNDELEDSDVSSAEEGVDFISESELMDSEIDDDVLEELEDEPVDEAILDLGDVDEASTKLDLARAYIDMEDFEGATEILEEVLTEGSDVQKSEAQQLLEKMN